MRKLLISTVVALALVGCSDPQGTAPATQSGGAVSPGIDRSAPPAVPSKAASLDARRAEFLNRIRAADPQFSTIQRALLNEKNELGAILQRDVDMNDIPRLMRSLLTEMAREFPGQDLTIVAYTPTEPPMKIGTGRLNAATRELTYTPTR